MGARLSWRGYASILAIVRNEPTAAVEIAAKVGASVPGVRLLMRRMHALGLVRIAGWSEPSLHVVALPMYGFGPGIDVRPPLTFRGRASHHQSVKPIYLKPRSDLIAFADMVRQLREIPISRNDLARSAGLEKNAVAKLIEHMHALKLVYVERYQPGRSGIPAQCFRLGSRPDAPYPGRAVRAPRIDACRMAPNSSVFHIAALAA